MTRKNDVKCQSKHLVSDGLRNTDVESVVKVQTSVVSRDCSVDLVENGRLRSLHVVNRLRLSDCWMERRRILINRPQKSRRLSQNLSQTIIKKSLKENILKNLLERLFVVENKGRI